MANIPSYDTDNFSFGPGILSLVAITAGGVSSVHDGTTSDLVDVGGVRSGGSFSVTRTKLDVKQGSPATLVKQYVTEEAASMQVNGIEWDLGNLRLALGAGTVASTDFSFGGDITIIDTAVKFVHTTPSGNTVTIRLWKAQGSGEMSITFGDDLHEIPYNFSALDSTNAWATTVGGAGAALATGARLFKISYVV